MTTTTTSLDSKPPRGQLNRPLRLGRLAQRPSWIINDLAPTRTEMRRPFEYAASVLLWASIRQRGYTMLGCRRGRTLYRLAREVDRADVSGALVDCGVWNGGSTALLSAGAPSRNAYAFDSFEGLPVPDVAIDGDDSVDWRGECVGVEENVRAAISRYASLDSLQIIKGWFADTFPHAGETIGPIAVLHADGDWYDSVRLTLDTFYDRVSPGGFVVIDDYAVWSGARRAVDEFRSERAITEPLVPVEAAAYWRKA